MNLRVVLWTLVMAYVGFLWVGKGSQSLNDITISGAVLGAVVGFSLAVMFTRRAKRRRT
jgi:drug/metabolite transporter (DMT)-like permease